MIQVNGAALNSFPDYEPSLRFGSFASVGVQSSGGSEFFGQSVGAGVNGSWLNASWINTGVTLAEADVRAGGFARVGVQTPGQGNALEIVAGGSLTAVQVGIQQRGRPIGSSTTFVGVTPVQLGRVIDGSEVDVAIEPEQGSTVIDGSESTVLITEESGFGIFTGSETDVLIEQFVVGTRNEWVPAPLTRIIQVMPKERAVPVIPKDRVIRFTGDDMGLSMETKVKQPREVVDYDIDFREWFTALGLDGSAMDDDLSEIVNAFVTPPGELTLGGDGLAPVSLIGEKPQIAKVWVSGGLDGREYKVTVKFRTRIGRVEEVDFLVIVEDQ